MSANFVAKIYIDALISAAIKWGGLPGTTFDYFWIYAEPGPDGWTRQRREVTAQTADRTGEMLWRANWDNTMGWGADEPGRPHPTMPAYLFEMLPGRPGALLVLRLLDYYRYQTESDADPFMRTEAWAFCESLRSCANGRLPGLDELPWGIEDQDTDIFERYPEESPGQANRTN